MVGVIGGAQCTPGFSLFFGPLNTELRFLVLIISSPSVENRCVSFSFRKCEELMCFTSFFQIGRGTSLPSSIGFLYQQGGSGREHIELLLHIALDLFFHIGIRIGVDK